MKTREEIDDKYKISLKDMFNSDEEFLCELENVKKEMSGITKYEGHLLDSGNTLYAALSFDTGIDKRLERLYVYANLKQDFDLSENKANELKGKIVKVYQDYTILASFISPELLKSDYSLITKYYSEYPKLKEYENNLKDLFREADHILSLPEEHLLKTISEAFGTPEEVHTKLLDADLKFGNIKDEKGQSVELTTSNYATYIESYDRIVRKSTFKTFYQGYESVINSTAELLASEVKNNNAMARVRKYNSALEASLSKNNVSIKVFKTLLKSINDNLSIIHKEWDIRKSILALEDLHLYDTYVPLVKDYNKTYTYEEAQELVKKSLSVLGSDYTKVLEVAFKNNWLDVYPSLNKRSGGYCTSVYLAHPYVFLNFDGRYDEVSTIAHELGHAMHYYYAAQNQSYQDYGYSIFVAEVASQVNELLLSYYMLDHSNSKAEKLFILDELIKRFKASVVRQTMFSEFEYNIHEASFKGEILTKDYLNNEYYNLNKKYYGSSITIDDEIKYEWSRIPHFYYDFYVYQYSTGYISALKIANDIYNNKPSALANYHKFLGLGSTMDPVASLKVAGVDLTNEKIFNEAFAIFNKNMDDFVKLAKE